MAEPRIGIADRERAVELVEEGPGELREMFDLVTEALREIPWVPETVDLEGSEVARALALRPDVFREWFVEEYYTHKQGTVDTATKELVGTAIADRIGCVACVPHHSSAARIAGAPEEHVEAVRDYDERADELPERLRAAIDVGMAVAFDPAGVTDDDIARLVEAGYTDGEIVELVASALVSHKVAAFNRVLGLDQ